MDGFEEKLNAILSSPKDMEKILSLARELGGTDAGDAPPKEDASPASGLDPGMLGLLSRLMGELGSKGNDKAALAAAIKPYIRRERGEALDNAVRIAKFARVARELMKELPIYTDLQ